MPDDFNRRRGCPPCDCDRRDRRDDRRDRRDDRRDRRDDRRDRRDRDDFSRY